MYERRFRVYPISEDDFWCARPLLPEIGKQKNLFIFKAFTENFSVCLWKTLWKQKILRNYLKNLDFLRDM